VYGLIAGNGSHLERLLILLVVTGLDFLGRLNVILEVAASVLPSLQTLQEELGNLTGVLVGNGLIIGGIGNRPGWEILLCVSHDVCL